MPARRTSSADASPGADIAELYGLPLGEFTAARNALAARLRKAGDRDAAAEVQALVKPTPAAWAVNQLLRRERADFDALLAAGERARAALGRTLTGAGPEVVREALAEMRRRREQLLRRGADLLAGDGRAASAAQLERLAVDLEAMALSPAAQEAVERGWLDRDLDPPGFEVLAGLQLAALPPRRPAAEPPGPRTRETAAAEKAALAAPPAPPARAKPTPADRREEKAAREREEREEVRRRERQARLQEKVDQRAQEAEELAVQAGTAEHEAKVADSEARQAEKAALEARRRADQARQAADRARERADRAAERLAQAQSDLDAAP